jgi:hypothetical protein
MKEFKHLASIATSSTRLEASSTPFEKERKCPVGFYAPRCRKHSDEKAVHPGVSEFYEPKPLRRLITVCAWCNRVRNSKGIWHQIVNNPQVNGEGVFTHGICPECAEKSYSEYRLVTLASSAALPLSALAA